ncbi:membrane protein insertase YidC [Verrucomicrobiota bacterium sgz303538]
MDRKGIIGVAVAIITLVVWQIYYSREMQKYQEAQRAAATAAAASQPAQPEQPAPAAPSGTTPPAQASGATAQAPAAPAPAVEEKTERLATSSVEYNFTNQGGGIRGVVLLNHMAELGRVRGDETRVTLNNLGPVPIGAITERAGEETLQPFAATPNTQAGEITFERTDARQLQTVKKFTLPKGNALNEEYTTQLDVTFTNRGTQPIQVPAYFVYTGAAAPIHRNDQPLYTGVGYFTENGVTFKDLNKFSSGGFLGMNRQEQPTFQNSVNDLLWTGVTNQYFTTIITPSNAKGNAVWGHKFQADNVSLVGNSEKVSVTGVEGALGMPGFTLAPGQSVSQKFSIYTGPRELRRLQALGARQETMMNFGMFAIVSKALLTSMNWLNAKFHSYAAAIIVLTLIIKCALWPLQNKATSSMKKMQALQPKMTELREKYQDDPQRMNMELMKLYKDYGVNPFGGCLPMLVQIPIFFGFYNMLGKAVELRNSPFLWVKDLSQPDTIAHLGNIPINVLPLIMAGTMFWQMSISPKSGDAVQQRMFMFMPLIFVFFCYNFASALALYWTVQNIFSIAQLYVTRNQATPSLQKATTPGKKKRD